MGHPKCHFYIATNNKTFTATQFQYSINSFSFFCCTGSSTRSKDILSFLFFCMEVGIETTSNAFKITLPNTNFHVEEQKVQNILRTGGVTSATKKEARMNTVLELCRRKGFIVRGDVETELGVSQSTAILLLRELTDEGVLIKKGKTKNLRYYENK